MLSNPSCSASAGTDWLSWQRILVFDHQPVPSKTDHQMLLELSPRWTMWILLSNTASFTDSC
jgi:hypothetical protein